MIVGDGFNLFEKTFVTMEIFPKQARELKKHFEPPPRIDPEENNSPQHFVTENGTEAYVSGSNHNPIIPHHFPDLMPAIPAIFPPAT